MEKKTRTLRYIPWLSQVYLPCERVRVHILPPSRNSYTQDAGYKITEIMRDKTGNHGCVHLMNHLWGGENDKQPQIPINYFTIVIIIVIISDNIIIIITNVIIPISLRSISSILYYHRCH